MSYQPANMSYIHVLQTCDLSLKTALLKAIDLNQENKVQSVMKLMLSLSK